MKVPESLISGVLYRGFLAEGLYRRENFSDNQTKAVKERSWKGWNTSCNASFQLSQTVSGLCWTVCWNKSLELFTNFFLSCQPQVCSIRAVAFKSSHRMLAHILTWLVWLTGYYLMPDKQPGKSAILRETNVFGREITQRKVLVKDKKYNGWVVRINYHVFSPRKASSKLQEKLYFNVIILSCRYSPENWIHVSNLYNSSYSETE